jgi:hypothetical protein
MSRSSKYGSDYWTPSSGQPSYASYTTNSTPLSSPSPAQTSSYYSPRHAKMPTTSSPRETPKRSTHSRRASQDPGAHYATPHRYSSNYAPPPTSGGGSYYYSSPGAYTSPQYVSGTHNRSAEQQRGRTRLRRNSWGEALSDDDYNDSAYEYFTTSTPQSQHRRRRSSPQRDVSPLGYKHAAPASFPSQFVPKPPPTSFAQRCGSAFKMSFHGFKHDRREHRRSESTTPRPTYTGEHMHSSSYYSSQADRAHQPNVSRSDSFRYTTRPLNYNFNPHSLPASDIHPSHLHYPSGQPPQAHSHGRSSSQGPHYSSQTHSHRDRENGPPASSHGWGSIPGSSSAQQHQASSSSHRRTNSNQAQPPPQTPRPSTSSGYRPESNRRSSHSSRAPPPKSSQTPKPAPKPASLPRSGKVVTAEDLRKWKVPAGYSYKHWDPTEVPVFLLGSVFDTNSLGKWVYDWTVAYLGPEHEVSDKAGSFWLLLIQLAGKCKRAREILPEIRRQEKIEMIDDFMESGDRLMERLRKLLEYCEKAMYRAAKREQDAEAAKKGKTKSESSAERKQMPKSSGIEFVDTVFGPGRELERTEKLMTGIQIWSDRFDVNCEPILAAPKN